ncbi:alpha/beta hydrolase, partial [Kaarinaea lacus]
KAGIVRSAELIREIIDEQIQQGIARDKIVLAGFSQGGAMALHIGLRETKGLAGIMALSCYLPLADEMPVPEVAQDGELPIFMAHGNYDPIVPLQAGVMSKDMLTKQGYAITWRDYPMEHSVCVEEIADISEWLRVITTRE